jgi:hypothetical protein
MKANSILKKDFHRARLCLVRLIVGLPASNLSAWIRVPRINTMAAEIADLAI